MVFLAISRYACYRNYIRYLKFEDFYCIYFSDMHVSYFFVRDSPEGFLFSLASILWLVSPDVFLFPVFYPVSYFLSGFLFFILFISGDVSFYIEVNF